MRTSGEFPALFVDFFRLNGGEGGEVVQLVLHHGKLKPPDIYQLLQESTPNLREHLVSFSAFLSR
jgi:hypothetical protein